MKVGFSETDITPAVGMERPGGYNKVYLTGVRNPLKVRAGVFDDGKERVALVGLDTCTIAARTVARARSEIERRLGLKGDRVLIGASHTHSGGPLFGLAPDQVEKAPKLIRELVLKESSAIDPLYERHVIGQIVTAVCEADRCKQKAQFSVGNGIECQVVFNRRFRMKNGRVFTHPGKGNAEIDAPAGPIDPAVGVLAAWRSDGTLLGCVVNYACHGTALSDPAISSDWIGFMESTVKAVMGAQAVTVFLNGACGDVTQVDNRSTRESEFGVKWARMVGARVGAEVVKVLVSSEKGEFTPVAAQTVNLKIKCRSPSPASLRTARALILKTTKRSKKNSATWLFAKERLILDWLRKKTPTVNVEIQGIQIGPAIFLSNPSEYFCELGLEIKRFSPFPFTFVVELANGSVGYVPTEESFSPNGGGYETILTSYSNLDPSAGRRIQEASLQIARRLKPGRIPRGKQAAKSVPWDYGVLGPERD